MTLPAEIQLRRFFSFFFPSSFTSPICARTHTRRPTLITVAHSHFDLDYTHSFTHSTTFQSSIINGPFRSMGDHHMVIHMVLHLFLGNCHSLSKSNAVPCLAMPGLIILLLRCLQSLHHQMASRCQLSGFRCIQERKYQDWIGMRVCIWDAPHLEHFVHSRWRGAIIRDCGFSTNSSLFSVLVAFVKLHYHDKTPTYN